MYADNALFFPAEAVSALGKLRGPSWQALVRRALTLPTMHEEYLALMLMMIRLNGCATCETDSYRAMRGCTLCAIQSLRRFKGEDEELLCLYEKALCDVRHFIQVDPRARAIIGGQPTHAGTITP